MSVFVWHGFALSLAWLVLLPAGTLVARFCKVLPGQDFPRERDNLLWWHLHRGLQYAGLAATIAGVWLVWHALGHRLLWGVTHVQIGLAVLALAGSQLLSAMLRGSKGGPTDSRADPADPATWRGDHYDMTLRRLVFEFWHKRAGYAALALALAAIWTGIGQAGLPAWLKLVPMAALAIFVAIFAAGTLGGRHVPTWEAIWGPRP